MGQNRRWRFIPARIDESYSCHAEELCSQFLGVFVCLLFLSGSQTNCRRQLCQKYFLECKIAWQRKLYQFSRSVFIGHDANEENIIALLHWLVCISLLVLRCWKKRVFRMIALSLCMLTLHVHWSRPWKSHDFCFFLLTWWPNKTESYD